MDVVGYEMSKNCADQVFKEAGFAEGQGRDQVGVVELHDCFAANEVCITFSRPQPFIYLCPGSSLLTQLWDSVPRERHISSSSVEIILCVA